MEGLQKTVQVPLPGECCRMRLSVNVWEMSERMQVRLRADCREARLEWCVRYVAVGAPGGHTGRGEAWAAVSPALAGAHLIV